MRAAKVQASLRIRAVSPEPSLLAHTSSESRGTFRQKARSLAPLNGWACAVKVCHDGMLEDTNSLDGAQMTAAMHSFNQRMMAQMLSKNGNIDMCNKLKVSKINQQYRQCNSLGNYLFTVGLCSFRFYAQILDLLSIV